MLGLPYAFASHFAPQALLQAVEIYRERFEPSEQLAEPYVMVGCNAIVADTEEEAKRLFTSPQQNSTRMLRGTRGKLPKPIDNIDEFWSPEEKAQASSMLACSFYGSSDTIAKKLAPLIEQTGADERSSPPRSGITMRVAVRTAGRCDDPAEAAQQAAFFIGCSDWPSRPSHNRRLARRSLLDRRVSTPITPLFFLPT